MCLQKCLHLFFCGLSGRIRFQLAKIEGEPLTSKMFLQFIFVFISGSERKMKSSSFSLSTLVAPQNCKINSNVHLCKNKIKQKVSEYITQLFISWRSELLSRLELLTTSKKSNKRNAKCFKNFNNPSLSMVTSNQSSCYLPLCFHYSLIVVFENKVGKGAVYMDHLVFFVLLLNSRRLNYCWPSTDRLLTSHMFFRL